MSRDALKDIFPISVSFVDGEQPTGAKFTGWAEQTDSGLANAEAAIGDVWDDRAHTNGVGGNYILSTQPALRHAHLANLTRLLGPASALNPFRQGRDGISTVELVPADIPEGVNEFQLPVPPLVVSGTYPAHSIAIDTGAIGAHIHNVLNTVDGSVFATQKTTKTDVNSTGEYYIDMQGRVFTYDATGDYSAVATQEYTADMLYDTYDHATFNVIPDPNENSNLCVVSDNGDGTYRVTTPEIRYLARYDELGNQYEFEDDVPEKDAGMIVIKQTFQADLPWVLQDNLSAGDPIPDGFVRLWDEEADGTYSGGYVAGLTFYYNDAHSVDVSGATLEVCSDRYRLVTVGTTVTELLGELRFRYRKHNHDGTHGDAAISHNDLSDTSISPDAVSDNWGITVTAPISQIDGFDHPQYLCRYGWSASLDGNIDNNSMLGPIFMQEDRSDYTMSVVAGTDDSHKIYFGTTDNYIYYEYNGMLSWNGMAFGSADNVFGLITDGDSVYLDFRKNDSAYGRLHWKNNDSQSFAFYHDGNVSDSIVQAGSFRAHGGALPVSSWTGVANTNVGSGGVTVNAADDSYSVLDSGGLHIHLDGGEDLYLHKYGTNDFQLETEDSADLHFIADGDMYIGVTDYLYLDSANASHSVTLAQSGDTTTISIAADTIYLKDTGGGIGYGMVIPVTRPNAEAIGSMYVDAAANKLYVYCGAGNGGWQAATLT